MPIQILGEPSEFTQRFTHDGITQGQLTPTANGGYVVSYVVKEERGFYDQMYYTIYDVDGRATLSSSIDVDGFDQTSTVFLSYEGRDYFGNPTPINHTLNIASAFGTLFLSGNSIDGLEYDLFQQIYVDEKYNPQAIQVDSFAWIAVTTDKFESDDPFDRTVYDQYNGVIIEITYGNIGANFFDVPNFDEYYSLRTVQVSEDPLEEGYDGHMVHLNTGNVFVTWQLGDTIKYRLFDNTGDALMTSQIGITDPGLAAFANPEVIELSDGTVLLSYMSDNAVSATSGHDVMARRFDANGVALGNAFALSEDSADSEAHVAVTAISTGFIAFWVDTTADGDSVIQARAYDNSGVAMGTEFIIAAGDIILGYDSVSAVTYGDDMVRVMWAQRDVNADGEVFDNTRTLTLDAASQVGQISGTRASDVLDGTSTADSLYGFGGDDVIQGLAGNDFISGSVGNDALSGGAGDDEIYGGVGNDTLDGGAGEDEIYGGDGNDDIDGGVGVDRIFAGYGNDLIDGGAGSDLIVGGIGNDTVSYENSASGVMVDLGEDESELGQGGDAQGDRLREIENLIGSDFDDTLIGNNDFNILAGGAGNDTLIGVRSGFSWDDTPPDLLIGGEGADHHENGSVDFSTAIEGLTVELESDVAGTGAAEGDTFDQIYRFTATEHADIITGYATHIMGLGGNDIFYSSAYRYTTYDGGEGADFIDYSAANARVGISLESGRGYLGAANGDRYISIEVVRGTAFNDQLTGLMNASDTLLGGRGDDSLNGGGGDDFVFGEGGNDFIIGGGGSDRYDGGSGIDTVHYGDSGAGVTVNLVTGVGSGGDAAGDTLIRIENLTGSAFNDVLTGTSGANILRGGAGSDIIEGGAGADRLEGGSGFDVVSYRSSSTGVHVSLEDGQGYDGDALGDIVLNFEVVRGSHFDDLLQGSVSQGDFLLGGRGDDTLDGFGGNDRMYGEGGDDFFFSGNGADFHSGGTGSDTVSYQFSSTRIVVDLEGNFGQIGHANGDTFASIENIIGTSFSDQITGSSVGNVLNGGGGADIITGGRGADFLSGGIGADTFVFNQGDGFDRVTDFTTQSGDVIDLTDFGFNSFAQLSSLFVQNGDDTIIIFDSSNAVRLVDVDVADLSANDFLI